MSKEEFSDLLDRYIKGEASDEERQQFDRYFEALQQKDTFIPLSDPSSLAQLKADLYESVMEATFDKRIRRFPLPTYWRVAASIVLLITLTWIFYGIVFRPAPVRYITRTTDAGQRAKVTLGDGSTIMLNSGSSLTYPEKFNDGRREVRLTGEAFFDVQKDPDWPFVVKTGSVETSVLGTSFNINTLDNDDVEVTVKTGKVKVESLKYPAASVTLLADQQVRFESSTGQLTKQKVAADHYTGWMNYTMYLDNTPLKQVTQTLSRWHGVEIIFADEAVGLCRLTGKYKSDKLINIMEGLKFVQGIEYRFINAKKILITGSNCK